MNVDCEICDRTVKRTHWAQKTCLSTACRTTLTKRTSKRHHDARKKVTYLNCEFCDKRVRRRSFKHRACNAPKCKWKLRATYQARADVIFKCCVCEKPVAQKRSDQKTCWQAKCERKRRLKLRRAAHKKLTKERRVAPICLWCGDPIHERYKRQYHAACRVDKNRLRVRDYHRQNRPRQVPKQARHYKDFVVCKYCETKVRRTGAQQFTCTGHACRLACKRDCKTKHRIRRRELATLHAKKAETFHKHNPRVSISPRLDQVSVYEARVS